MQSIINELQPLLDRDSVLLTVNRRLALNLQRAFDVKQLELSLTAWPTPNILPLNTWLETLWREQSCPHPQLLNDLQEQFLWQKIIDDAIESDQLLQPHSAATVAKQAWQLLYYWQLDAQQFTPYLNQDVEAFCRWAEQMSQHCLRANCITQAELPLRLSACLETLTHLPKRIMLYGFDELPPAVANCLTQLQNRVEMVTLEHSKQNAQIQCITMNDSEQEITSMARWAKQLLKQNPQQQIGCIVTNLNKTRGQVESIFNRVFVPESILPGMITEKPPFNISASQSLKQFPIVQTALSALRLATGDVDIHHLADLLQSPFLCSNEIDRNAGAELDTMLREFDQVQIQHTHILKRLPQCQAIYPDNTWNKRLRNFFKACKDLPKKQRPSQWAQQFIVWLQCLAWPGGRTLDTMQYQLLSRFKKLLSEFVYLDTVCQDISLTRALSILNTLAQQTPFQAEGSEAPIQILGVLESAGCEFDSLWMMGLDNETWPGAAKPNPFIPYPLQVEYQLPHSSAERELAYAQKSMQRLLKSAPTILLSSPLQDGDRQLQKSPLLNEYSITTLDALNLKNETHYTLDVFNHKKIECIEDNFAPKVSKQEQIKGGSFIIKQQALCPFRAFASVRLEATEPAQPNIGISSANRGILIHNALERVWSEIKDQSQLLQFTTSELATLIDECVKKAIQDYVHRHELNSQDPFLRIETTRLTSIIQDWLNLEKQRAPFKVIEHEKQHQFNIGELSLNVKIDRIDELEDGHYFIIDYKTGRALVSQWFGERPIDPQLPLYLQHQRDQTTGMAFAHVQNGNTKFSGLCASKEQEDAIGTSGVTDINSLKEFDSSWQQQLNDWQHTLTTLAEEFIAGDAHVDPVNEIDACQYCGLKPLCRVEMV